MKFEDEVRLRLQFARLSTRSLAKQEETAKACKPVSKTKAANDEPPKAVAAVSASEAKRRYEILRSVGEECVTEADLDVLVKKKPEFRLYDGFEPSGRMHIAQGIFKSINVNKCTSAGGTFVFWVADWFGLMNDKMGGDLLKIQTVGEYFIEVWKASGMNLDNVEFRWASKFIIDSAASYWNQVLDIGRSFTIQRIKKCCQIMGRTEGTLTAAQILYPLMQCADIFFLGADICQLGVDQRKVNMLAREYCDLIGRKLKPIILSHHMLYSLAKGEPKMSKSKPDSAIFMEDTAEEVKRKINNAYCPSIASASQNEASLSLVEDELMNPCLDYVKYIVLSRPGATFPSGGTDYTQFESVKSDFLAGKLSESDLKTSLIKEINSLLEPVRNHFTNDPHARDLLERIKRFKSEVSPPVKRHRRACFLGPDSENRCVVIAPLLSEHNWNHLSLVFNTRLALIRATELFRANNSAGQIVLYLPDLNAVVCNSFGKKKKIRPIDCIRSAYDSFVAALGAIYSISDVQILRQSSSMEQHVSDYWLSVIDVGRHFSLEKIHEAVGTTCIKVGEIVAGMMHCGDVQALAPTVLVSTKSSREEDLNKLACNYIDSRQDYENRMVPPILEQISPVHVSTGCVGAATSIHLTIDEKFENGARKKLKQAFCEPGNGIENPVIDIIDALFFCNENPQQCQINTSHGLKTFANAKDLRLAFSRTDEIHPGELKAAAELALAKTYSSLEKAFSSTDPKDRALLARYFRK